MSYYIFNKATGKVKGPIDHPEPQRHQYEVDQTDIYLTQLNVFKEFVNSLPEIEVHPSLAAIWEDGKKVVDGKDFILYDGPPDEWKPTYNNPDDPPYIKVLIPLPADSLLNERGYKCQICTKEYNTDVIIPDNLWAKISPKPVEGFKGGGLLCPSCIVNGLIKLFQQPPTPLPSGKEEDQDENEYILEELYKTWKKDEANQYLSIEHFLNYIDRNYIIKDR